MGTAASSWDPLALCSGADDDASTSASNRLRRGGYSDDNFVSHEDVQLQEAIQRSYGEYVDADDEQLQKAILASQQPTKRPDEVKTASVLLLEAFLRQLGMQRFDVGSRNLSEGGSMLSNQCLYLAVARSWLADAAHGGGMLIRDSALQLKRDIESSVLRVRGDSARKDLGEETEAYADFLACALCDGGSAESGVSSAAEDLAIAIFASASGGLEVYQGRGYSNQPREHQVANLSMIWHCPGHFEAVVARGTLGKGDFTLDDLLRQARIASVPCAVVRA